MKKLLAFALFTFIFSFTYGQSVKVKDSKFLDNKIYVDYNISGMTYYQTIKVELYVSLDKGQTYVGPLQQLSGDFGEIKKGGDHTIIWDFLKEMPFTEEELIFDIRGKVNEQDRKSKYYISYVGNFTTPIGVRVGIIGKTGFYIEGRLSTSMAGNTNYNYNGQVYDYDKTGYYQLSGKDQNAAMTILIGIDKQISWNTFLYAAAGYGKDTYNFEIDDYSYENSSKTGSSWVNDETNSFSGVEIDLGLMFRLGDFILSAGGSVLNFEQPGFTVGLGYNFSIK